MKKRIWYLTHTNVARQPRPADRSRFSRLQPSAIAIMALWSNRFNTLSRGWPVLAAPLTKLSVKHVHPFPQAGAGFPRRDWRFPWATFCPCLSSTTLWFFCLRHSGLCSCAGLSIPLAALSRSCCSRRPRRVSHCRDVYLHRVCYLGTSVCSPSFTRCRYKLRQVVQVGDTRCINAVLKKRERVNDTEGRNTLCDRAPEDPCRIP